MSVPRFGKYIKVCHEKKLSEECEWYGNSNCWSNYFRNSGFGGKKYGPR